MIVIGVHKNCNDYFFSCFRHLKHKNVYKKYMISYKKEVGTIELCDYQYEMYKSGKVFGLYTIVPILSENIKCRKEKIKC